MKRLLLALTSLLLGAYFGYTKQEDIVLHTQFQTIDEITLCTGTNDGMCIKTVDKVKELLPLELQKIIVDSTQFIEVYTGDRQDFLKRMTTEEMIPILHDMDKVGYHSLEAWGGATFDACLRFLNEVGGRPVFFLDGFN